MKKITRATFKSFVAKNKESLVIKVGSSFNGMIDGCEWYEDNGFSKAELTEKHASHTLGVRGVWLVGRSRDYFSAYDDGTVKGISVSNSCGHFTVAVAA